MKKNKVKFEVSTNTDTVDIDNDSIGLNVRTNIEGVSSKLYHNRGLHVQIRHNQDKKAFERACQLSKLFSAAPEMLKTLQDIRDYIAEYMPLTHVDDRGHLNDIHNILYKLKVTL